MQLIKNERAYRFYSPSGERRDKIIGKNGNERTIYCKEAKAAGCLVSVTQVLNVLPKPELERWKIEQGIISALTLPRNPGEELDDFARRAAADSQEEASKAASFGSMIHGCITGDPVTDPKVFPFMEKFFEWKEKNIEQVIFQEQFLSNPAEGYAGTGDMLCVDKSGDAILIDFKCRKIKDPKKLPVYDTDYVQLCAYASCNWSPEWPQFNCVASVVINSETPEEPHLHIWSEEDDPESNGLKKFRACLALWKLINKF